MEGRLPFSVMSASDGQCATLSQDPRLEGRTLQNTQAVATKSDLVTERENRGSEVLGRHNVRAFL